MRRRGMKPSWIACCVTEKAPEITAWQAMTAAIVARTTSGSAQTCGREQDRTGFRCACASREQQRALPHIVQHQRRQHEAQPRDADRLAAEMPHVGIERLGAGHRQHDRAQRQEGPQRPSWMKNMQRVMRRQRPQAHRGFLAMPVTPITPSESEIDQHDRPEEPPDRRRCRGAGSGTGRSGCATAIGMTNSVETAAPRPSSPSTARQHRDRRRDHAIAVEQRGGEHAEQ